MPYIGIGVMFFSAIEITIKRFKKIRYVVYALMLVQISFFAKVSYSQTQVWENSLTLWNNFIDKYPNNSIYGYLNRADYYRRNNLDELALNDINTALSLNINNYRAYTSRGKYYLDMEKYEKALLDYEKALSINSSFTNAIFGRAASNYFLGNYNIALQDFNFLIKNDSINHSLYNYRGNVYFKINNLENALNDFNKAIELNNDYEEAVQNKIAVLTALNDTLALKEFHNLTGSGSQLISLTNQGAIFFDNNKLDSALSYFNSALKIEDNYSEALKGRANVYYKKQNFEKAIMDITNYLRNNSENHDMRQRLIYCYLNENRFNDALFEYNRLIKMKSDNGEYFKGRGFLNMKLGNYDDALHDFLMANQLGVEIDPKILNSLRSMQQQNL
jgi:tetratricopeptide (TPR) repeat protein